MTEGQLVFDNFRLENVPTSGMLVGSFWMTIVALALCLISVFLFILTWKSSRTFLHRKNIADEEVVSASVRTFLLFLIIGVMLGAIAGNLYSLNNILATQKFSNEVDKRSEEINKRIDQRIEKMDRDTERLQREQCERNPNFCVRSGVSGDA